MRWLRPLLTLFLVFFVAYPQVNTEAARRGRKKVVKVVKKGKGQKKKKGNQNKKRKKNDNAAPSVGGAKSFKGPQFGGGHDVGVAGDIPQRRFGGQRPIAEVSGVNRRKPLVKAEPPANTNDPCGIRFAAPRSDELAIALYSEGFYLDRSTGLCERGFRGAGGDPFPFRSLGECQRAVAAGGCSLKDSDPPLRRGKLAGRALQITGDLRPTQGPQNGGSTVVKPLATRIHIFRGNLSHEGKPFDGEISDQSPFLVVSSDGSGNFAANLPPGTYTVFAEVDGKLVHSDGAFPKTGDEWTSVRVVEGETSVASVVDSRQVTH